jgi:hypothetical protein
MARDFWFQAIESQAVTLLCFVHCRPPESSRFHPRRGDSLETVNRKRSAHQWENPHLTRPAIAASGSTLARAIDSSARRNCSWQSFNTARRNRNQSIRGRPRTHRLSALGSIFSIGFMAQGWRNANELCQIVGCSLGCPVTITCSCADWPPHLSRNRRRCNPSESPRRREATLKGSARIY